MDTKDKLTDGHKDSEAMARVQHKRNKHLSTTTGGSDGPAGGGDLKMYLSVFLSRS